MKANGWTKDEDKVLLTNIKKYSKKVEAYAATSNQIGRSEAACEKRWRELKKDLDDNFYELKENTTQPTNEVTTEAVFNTSMDIIAEMTNIIEQNNANKKEIESLHSKLKSMDGEVFDLNFQLSQAHNEIEQKEFQITKFTELVEASMTEQAKYIEENRKFENQKEIHEGRLMKLQDKLAETEATVARYELENERLNKEKEEYMQENNTIMNLFNKARKMFTNTDKDEPAKFKMERNGNLERVR